jgi:hypothetical protein
MGGHGTWHLGATYPDRFAAIGPSAGWISFMSYGGRYRPQSPNPGQEMLLRAASPSDTLAFARNYLHHGVYILHGDKDDNVPVTEARTMKARLSEFHHDLDYFEEKGAGHWWSRPGMKGGAACVDWPPMFEFFAKHMIPSTATVRQVEFATASPGVSAWSHWASIEAQIHPLKRSTVKMGFDPEQRRFSGTTENVARLCLDLGHLPPGNWAAPVQIELDGQMLEIPGTAVAGNRNERLWLQSDSGKWSLTGRPSPALKGPARYGPFKEAFRNRVVFVYGTKGTAPENAWALARARYDAETFWYRGNGSVDVVSDVDFSPAADPDRNVILYGHADMHAAWKALLSQSPVQVYRGRLRIGDREQVGNDLACLFLRPRPGSDRALVGVVAGCGMAGCRLTERVEYLRSGTGIPDCLVLRPESALAGGASLSVAGFFGSDWGIARGEFIWNK